jgi:hypothetical protein
MTAFFLFSFTLLPLFWLDFSRAARCVVHPYILFAAISPSPTPARGLTILKAFVLLLSVQG